MAKPCVQPFLALARLAGLALALGALCLSPRAQAGESTEPYLSLSASGRYDDFVPGGGAGMVTRLAPEAGLRLHWPRLVLRLDGIAAYDRYEGTTAPVPDSWNVHGTFGADARVTRRFELHALDQFVDARDPQEIDRSFVVTPPGVEVTDNYSSLDATYAALRILAVDAGYAFHYTRFGDLPLSMGGAALPGVEEHDAKAGLGWRLDELDFVRTGYRAQVFDVPDGAVTHSPTVAYMRRIAPSVRTEAEVGPIFYFDQSPAAANGLSWRGRAFLMFDTPHWRVMASFDRDLVGGTGAAPVILANYAIASIRFRPLRWFDLTAKGDYFRNALPPAGALLVDGYDVSAEALFRLGSSIEMAGFYSFRDQVAEEMMGPLGFRRNVVGLRLTALYAPASRTVKEVK